MLLDAEFVRKLEELGTRRSANAHRTRTDRIKGFVRRKDGRARSRTERFVARLLAHEYGPIVFVFDASQTMTFHGEAPPVRSEKFAFQRRLVAAVAYAALLHDIPVHLVPIGCVQGRRGPVLRDRAAAPLLLASLEKVRPGGSRRFGYAIRNQILRGGPDAFVVVISDFRDESWRQAIPALVAGEARVALVQIVDPRERPAASEYEGDATPESVPFAVGTPDDIEPDSAPEMGPTAVEIHARLAALAHDHRMDLVAIYTDTELEEAVLKAVGPR